MNPLGGPVLAVITARGGSKGLPRKNLLPCAGQPLIAWTITAALQAQCVGRTIVSTDDPEIARASEAAGADVPFLRPAELADDRASSLDVLRHAIAQCPGYSDVLLLQPTSPLRDSRDIDAAYAQMQQAGAPSCVSLCEVSQSPWLMVGMEADGRIAPLLPEPAAGLRRQDLPPAYRLNGAIYLARTDWFLQGGRLVGEETVGYRMPEDRSIDIDTQADLDIADHLLRQRLAL